MSSVANVVDGKLVYETTPTNANKQEKGTSSLGKDEFLTLLTTQMQYQDPLNPSSDTDFIAQLAQFTSLEQMQNLNTSMSNQTAFGLVGKNVIMSVGLSEGKVTSTVAGYVQYVEMKDGKAYLSINDNLYSIDDLDTVVDDKYLDAVLGGNSNTENNTQADKNNKNQSNSENKVS